MALVRFPLEDLIGPAPIRERDFRARLNAHDLEPYHGKAVMIPWVHNDELPIWVYLMAAARLAPVAAVLSFGEACSPVVLLQRMPVIDNAQDG